MPLNTAEIAAEVRRYNTKKDEARSALLKALINEVGSENMMPLVRLLDTAIESAYAQGKFKGRKDYGRTTD